MEGYMKGFFFGLIILMILFASCDTGLTSGGGYDSDSQEAIDGGLQAALAAVRNAASDPVANCTEENAHYHDGVCYAGHYNHDGCSHKHGGKTLAADSVCTIGGCTESGTHKHNGQAYGGHHGEDGCNKGSGHHGNGLNGANAGKDGKATVNS
jgi:hypothetical protein